jgi:PHD/YefM family antitoxin component YafN of YafNO toxin-antitoxin module
LATKSAPVVTRLPFAKAQAELGRVARRAHRDKEYFILEEDGAPVIGIMDADELEDYLELRDPVVQRHIRESNEDVRAGRVRPAEQLLAEIRASIRSSTSRARKNRRQK